MPFEYATSPILTPFAVSESDQLQGFSLNQQSSPSFPPSSSNDPTLADDLIDLHIGSVQDSIDGGAREVSIPISTKAPHLGLEKPKVQLASSPPWSWQW